MATQSSNKTMYWIIGIVILALVVFGGYKLWHHATNGSMMQYRNTTSGNNPNPPTQNTTTGSNASGLPNKTDASNQQLDQDLQNVQNSMNQLQQDQGTANQDTTNQAQDTPQP